MAIKASTGLRNYMLSGGSAKAGLDGGHINIYGGVAAPASGDAAVPGGATLLCKITLNSTATGINFDTAAAAGVLAKAPAEIWSGVNAAGGSALWYRHVEAADDGSESTTAKRIQGSIGTSGADLNLSNTTLTMGATQTIDNYSIALPTL